MMRRLTLFTGTLALAVFASPSQAVQSDYSHTVARVGSVAFINRRPDCAPFSLAYDPVWIHGEGWTMPRIGWPMLYSSLSLGAANAAHAVGVPPLAADLSASIAFAFFAHARQAYRGTRHGAVYQLNVLDWIGDAGIRSRPLWRAHPTAWLTTSLFATCITRP